MSASTIALMVGALALVAVTSLVLRQISVSRQRWVFECVLWRRGILGRSAWQQGLMRFASDELHWYRALSWRTRPERRIARADVVREQRSLIGPGEGDGEDFVLVDMEIRGGERLRMIMARGSASALSAWLEAAPMGLVLGDAD